MPASTVRVSLARSTSAGVFCPAFRRGFFCPDSGSGPLSLET